MTEPAERSGAGWALDLGFHLGYGLVTVIAYDTFLEQ
jgi:hypothetical protein